MARSDRPRKSAKRVQIIYSEPVKLFKEKYLTPKGEKLMLTAKTKAEKQKIWDKYGKNKYINNPNAKPIGQITHY